jgi:hypothetical protein
VNVLVFTVYLLPMPRLPGWVPRNPGCGCLILLFFIIATMLIWFDAP